MLTMGVVVDMEVVMHGKGRFWCYEGNFPDYKEKTSQYKWSSFHRKGNLPVIKRGVGG